MKAWPKRRKVCAARQNESTGFPVLRRLLRQLTGRLHHVVEEFFEILTWGQLGLHKKPAGILNSRGFFDPLIDFIQKMVDEGFLKTSNQEMLLLSDDIEDLLAKMESYIAPSQGKWIFRDPVT